MHDHRPSRTAAFVAVCRGLTGLLPEEARLSRDPFGLRFGGRVSRAAGRFAARAPRLAMRASPRLVTNMVLSLQLRTRVIDDALLRFVGQGGRQVLLLGAGFDCRAARLRAALGEATVFEVDHPATQAEKRAVLADAESARVAYLAWNFERDPMAELPARLAALGHDAARPTFTIWEGVTMYLTEGAIEATVAALRALGAPRSELAMTYLDRAAVEHPPLDLRLASRAVALVGEPFRFGWDPPSLPAWLAARRFALISDRADDDYARELLPAAVAKRYRGGSRHIALAERSAE